MTNVLRNSGLIAILASSAFTGWAASFPQPSKADMAELVGQPLPSPIPRISWKAGDPSPTNATVYAVAPPTYDAGRLTLLGNLFGVKGQPEQIPLDFAHAPGMWIVEKNATNAQMYRSVAFSFRTGYLLYDSADSGYRWDLTNHVPRVHGVPTPAEARDKALRLIETLGIRKDQLEHDESGVRWSYTTDGTTYTDKKDGTRKRAVYRCNIMFWQGVPRGAKTLSVGSGGIAQVGFISGGEVSNIQILLRSLKPVGESSALTKDAIIKSLKAGRAWTWKETVSDSFTVTNCGVVYPQGNLSYHQNYVWPFYSVAGFFVEDGETNGLTVYVPFKQ